MLIEIDPVKGKINAEIGNLRDCLERIDASEPHKVSRAQGEIAAYKKTLKWLETLKE